MTGRPRILALFGSAVLFGQERGNIETLLALKEQGCEVLCLVRDEDWSVNIPAELDARGLAWLKVPYIEHRLPGRLRYVIFRNPVAFLRANWRFFRIVRRFRPTHVHAFNQLYLLNFLIGLAVTRLPMVFRAGDEPTVHNWIWRAVWRFVVWQADAYVANSRFVADTLCAHGVAADRVTVIYNRPPHRSKASESLPIPSNGHGVCLVTFVGQVSAHKGVDVLIEAFRDVAGEYPGAQLVVAGRISEWSGDAWARKLKDDTVNDPILRKRVHFIGEVDDVPGLLSRSRIHVAPSIFNDPSPNVVMEAKQAACPSIVFPRGGMPELVEDGVDGFMCHEATSACLAGALRRYLGSSDLASRHGQAARASLARLGVEEFAQRWLQVYLDAWQQHLINHPKNQVNADMG